MTNINSIVTIGYSNYFSMESFECMMKNNLSIQGLASLTIILLISVFIFSACQKSEKVQSDLTTEYEKETDSALSIEPESKEKETEEVISDLIIKRDIQNLILTLKKMDANSTEDLIIEDGFIADNGHLYIVLHDETAIDAGMVQDNNFEDTKSTKQYTVDFIDYDDTLLCSRQVNEGNMAIAPVPPEHEGLIFTGWDASFVSVNADLKVTAQYQSLVMRPQISVNNTAVFSEERVVEVSVQIRNNPGILGMTLQLNYDSDMLKLTDLINGEALGCLTLTKPGKLVSPCKISWDGIELDDTDIQDGEILTLVFEISEKAIPGVYPLSLSYEEDGIINKELTPINVEIESGKIIIME